MFSALAWTSTSPLIYTEKSSSSSRCGQMDKLTGNAEFVYLLITYLSMKHLSNNFRTCGNLFSVFSTCLDFNASIYLYKGIILISKLYPSRCEHLKRSTNRNLTELTKKSTLFFNFSFKRPRTHGCCLGKSNTCVSVKPKLIKHCSFQPMLYFPTHNIAYKAYANPFLCPNPQPI